MMVNVVGMQSNSNNFEYYLGSSDAAYGEAVVTVGAAVGRVDIGAIEDQAVGIITRAGGT